MIELEEALDLLAHSVRKGTKTERLDILSALGRISAEDVTAPFSVPHFPKSAMDGYAVRSCDTEGASPERGICFQVIGEICAGDYLTVTPRPFTAVRVMTGGMVPEGYDCVIRQEETDYGQEQAEVFAEGKPWENYCKVGEDIEAGASLISGGTRLKSGHIGILASLGIREITVYRSPRAGIISTGNELVSLEQPIGRVGVYPSSAYTIAARLRANGVEVAFMELCPDDSQAFIDMIEEKAPQAEVIITTGALSVGKKDFLPGALEKMGVERLFQQVNMRPGTPVMASRYKETVILSLSGYPFAAMVNFQLFFWPVLAGLVGDDSLSWKRTKAVVAEGSIKPSKKRRFLQAFADEAGVHINERKQHSSVLSELIHSNCMIDQEKGRAVFPGDTVDIIYWSKEIN